MKSLLIAAIALLLASSPAAAQSPAIEDILTLRQIGGLQDGLSVSPDGEAVAFFERETLLEEDRYRYRLLVMPAAGGEAHAIADAGEAILRTATGRQTGVLDERTPLWSPDGAWIAYLARRDNRTELWRVRRNGGGARRLIGGERDIARFAWLNNREIVVLLYPSRADLAAQARQQDRYGYVVDDQLEPRYSLMPWPALTRDQQTIVLDTISLRMREAAPEEARALAPAAGYGAAAGVVAIDEEHGLRVTIAPAAAGDRALSPALALYAARDGEVMRCPAAECSGRMSGVWIADADRIAFQRRDGNARSDNSIYVWNIRDNAVELIRRADELMLDCEDIEGALICLQEAPAQPRRLISLSLQSGAVSVLYDPNPHWAQFALTRIERLSGADGYGNEGHAHLVWPHGYQEGRLYPMVIVQYRSRGFLRGGVGDEYPIHALAARGYFVLSVDRTDNYALAARLPPAEAQAQTELDGSELRMKQTQLENLLRQIEDRRIVDPTRIAITGFSDGAETAYWMLTRSNLIAVAVVSNPPVDPIAHALSSESFRRENRAVGMTGPWPDSPEPWASWWRENAVVYYAEQIRAPLLMNLSQSEALSGFPLAVRMRELGRSVEMYIYPGEYHVKWRPQHQLAAQRRALDWIDFWLLGIERDDPSDPGRPERWRALRTAHAASVR